MIDLTDKAVEKIKEIANSEGLEYCVRVRIIGGGCGGFQNDMSFDTNTSELDEIIEKDEVKIICDPVSYMYLENTIIDYLDDIMSAGFKFLNPNIKSNCGCGSSFSI